MTEIEVDENTAAYVRAQAHRAGLSETAWLARHFRTAALRESAATHAGWCSARAGLVEDEVVAVQAALDDVAR